MWFLQYTPQFRSVYREIAELEAREAWSRTELEAYQLDRLNALWGHAVAHVPYYRALRAARGLPAKFASPGEFAAAVPVLAKETLRDRAAEFRSEAADRGGWIRTSGSTGLPTPVYFSHAASRQVVRGRYRHQIGWGVDVFDRQAFLWGDGGDSVLPWPRRVIARARRRLQDWLRHRIRLSPLRVGPADLRGYLRRVRRFGPAALYAYSSAAYLLAGAAEAAGERFPRLKVVVLSAEPTPPQLVAAVERGFGVPAVSEYGSVETGPIAFEGRDRVLRVRDDFFLVETPARADGRHDILVTPLCNPSFPLLRYALGDVTDAPLDVPPRGLSALRSVTGRANDSLRTRTGRTLHWAALDFALEHDPRVRRFRAHQRADGSLAVTLEPTDPARPPDPRAFQRRFEEMLEGYPVQVSVVPAVTLGLTGKHRWVVSDLTAAGGGGHPPG